MVGPESEFSNLLETSLENTFVASALTCCWFYAFRSTCLHRPTIWRKALHSAPSQPPTETSTIVIDKGTKSPPGKKQDTALTDWKTSKKLYMAVFILAVISLTAALNRTPCFHLWPSLFRNLTQSEDLASAAAMLSFFRAFGQAAKVGIGGTVFQHQARKKILGYSFACL